MWQRLGVVIIILGLLARFANASTLSPYKPIAEWQDTGAFEQASCDVNFNCNDLYMVFPAISFPFRPFWPNQAWTAYASPFKLPLSMVSPGAMFGTVVNDGRLFGVRQWETLAHTSIPDASVDGANKLTMDLVTFTCPTFMPFCQTTWNDIMTGSMCDAFPAGWCDNFSTIRRFPKRVTASIWPLLDPAKPNARGKYVALATKLVPLIYALHRSYIDVNFTSQQPNWELMGPVNGFPPAMPEAELESDYTVSEFCDLDQHLGGSLIRNSLMGGSSGDLIMVTWREEAGNVLAADYSRTSVFFSGYDAFMSQGDFVGETYSAPSCVNQLAPAGGQTFVSVGYRSGQIAIFKLSNIGLGTVVWTLKSALFPIYNRFSFGSHSYLASAGVSSLIEPLCADCGLFPKAIFVDGVQADNRTDSLAIGLADGSFVQAFYNVTSPFLQSDCGVIACELGSFQVGCACKPCPAGFYRSDPNATLCSACGSPYVYCPQGSVSQSSVSFGYCTAWAPNQVPNYYDDLNYYKSESYLFGQAQVFGESGQTAQLQNLFTVSMLNNWMFGDMRSFRTRQQKCGEIRLDNETHPSYVQIDANNWESTEIRKVVTPSNVQTGDFVLRNFAENDGSDPGYLNVSIVVYPPILRGVVEVRSDNPNGPGYLVLGEFDSMVVKPDTYYTCGGASTFCRYKKYTRLGINTGAIPPSEIYDTKFFNVTIMVTYRNYWLQSISAGEPSYSFFIKYTFELTESVALAVPSQVEVSMITGQSAATIPITIYNLLESPVFYNVMVVDFYRNGPYFDPAICYGPANLTSLRYCSEYAFYDYPNSRRFPEWIKVAQENVFLNSIAMCVSAGPLCNTVDQPLTAFTKQLNLVFNTKGNVSGELINLPTGVYQAYLIEQSFSGQPKFEVGIKLTVTGGLVDYAKSTYVFENDAGVVQPYDGMWNTPYITAYEVNSFVQVKIQLRDQFGNPTSNTGGVTPQLKIWWAWVNSSSDALNGPSPIDYGANDNVICNKTSQGPCPLAPSLCAATLFAQVFGQNDGTYVGRFQIYTNGTYQIWVKEVTAPATPIWLNRFPVSGSTAVPNPVCTIVAPRSCADANASPSGNGDSCKCNPGYGEDVGAGVNGDVVCAKCQPGTYSTASSGGCQPCPVGQYQAEEGRTSCDYCTSFLQEPNAGRDACVDCLGDSFVQAGGPNWICNFCSISDQIRKKITNSTGGEVLFTHPYYPEVTLPQFKCSCKPTMYFDPVLNKCVTCPKGGFCKDLNRDDVLPLNGFWGPVQDFQSGPSTRRLLSEFQQEQILRALSVTNDTSVPEFIECRRSESCPGVIAPADLSDDAATASSLQSFLLSGNASCTVCEKGFTGPLCFKCAAGYTRSGVDSCSECLPRGVVVFLLILGGVFAICACVYIIRRTIANSLESTEDRADDSEEMILLKVLMSHLQAESMVQGIELEWPSFVMEMFNVFDLVSSAGQSVFSLDCFVDTGAGTSSSGCDTLDDGRLRTFFLSSLFIALLPVFGAIVSGLFWGTRRLYVSRKYGKTHGYMQYFLVSMIIIVFLLYPSLVRTGFKFFSCSRETILDARFVEADFNIVCWSSEHLSWAMTLGLGMIVVYALGIPAGMLYLLRKNVVHTTKYKRVYSFLFSGFQHRFYYWEVVIMIRKLCLAAASIMLKPMGADIQAFAAALIVFVCICLQLFYNPYIHGKMNFVETFGLSTLYLTLFLGLFQNSPSFGLSPNSSIHVAFGVIIVLINTCFLGYVFAQLFLVTYRYSAENGLKAFIMHSIFQVKDPNAVSKKKLAVTSSGDDVQDSLYKSKSQDPENVEYHRSMVVGNARSDD